MVTVALADDHTPTLKRISEFISNVNGYRVILEAENGYDLIRKIATLEKLPDIVFVDINMPLIDGVTVTYYLRVHYAILKIIGLSSYTEVSIIKKILLSGANGFIFKSMAEPIILDALEKIICNDIYIDNRIFIEQRELLNIQQKQKERINKVNNFGLTTREETFIILNASSLTYVKIAEIMFVETKTIQTYFDRIAKKLNVKNRQELTIFSLQNGLAIIADYN